MTFQLNGDFLCRFMDKVFKGFSQAYYPKGERKKMKYVGLCQFVTTYFIIEHFSTFAFYVI